MVSHPYDFIKKQTTMSETRTDRKGQYVIIDLKTMDFMKSEDEGKISFFNTEDEACTVCGMYEFENVWVMKLVYNHIEL